MQSTAGPSSSPIRTINIETTNLYIPKCDELHELKEAIDSELKGKDFFEITIEMVPCPNLTQSPFNLIQEGIGGNTAIFNFGDDINKTRTYEIKELLNSFEYTDREKEFFILGNGMAQHENEKLGEAELVMNQQIMLREKEVFAYKNKNRFITLSPENESCVPVEAVQKYIFPKNFTKGTFYLCDGIKTTVLKINAKAKTSHVQDPFYFINSMQNALYNQYGKRKQTVALGGIYIINNERGWEHMVTRNDGKSLPADSSMKYCCVKTPERIISIFDGNRSNDEPTAYGSRNPLMEINSIKSSHCLSHQNGGSNHHFYELEEEDVEYTGYFYPAKKLYRVIDPVAQQ